MDGEVRRLAEEYWDATMRTSPTSATLLGDHRFDDTLEDLSADAEAAWRVDLRAFQARAEAIDPTNLDTQDRITRNLLIFETGSRIAQQDPILAEMACDPLTGPHSMLLQTAPQITPTTPEHAEALLDRYHQIDRFFVQAMDRLDAGVTANRPPVRSNVERVIGQLDAYLDSSLDADPFVGTTAPQGWGGEDAWRDRLRDVATDVIRPAFAAYRDGVAQRVLPSARDDERCGLVWVGGGAELYHRLIEAYTSLPLEPTEIHETGLAEIVGTLADEYRALGGSVFGVTEPAEVFDRLRHDPELRFRSPEEIRRVAEVCLAKADAAMADWFGRVPKAPCLVEDVPESLAEGMPPAYYFPPAEDGSRPGIYFVNTYDPAGRNRFEAEAVAFHEAIPGHHLQVTIAAELEDQPSFRRHGLSTAYVEGWGLYAERLADEMGLYSSDLDRLGILSADSWRAGRLVADTGIHAEGWSRRRAIEFFEQHSPVAVDTITQEVDRYIGLPGQALAYKIGQREFLRLRERAQSRLGDRFDIRAFHDAVLEAGPVTLPILAELATEWERRSAR